MSAVTADKQPSTAAWRSKIDALLAVYRIFRRPERARIREIIALAAGVAFIEAIGAAAVVPFVALINDPSYLHSEPALAWVYERGGFRTEATFISTFAVMLFILFLGKNAFSALVNQVQYRFVYKQMAEYSQDLFAKYLREPLEFHLRTNSAQLVRDVGTEVYSFFTHVVTAALIIVAEACVLAAIAMMLLFVSPVATIGAAVALAAIAAVFFTALRPRIRRSGQQQQQHNGERIKWIRQGLASLKEIKVLGRENFFIARFGQHEEHFASAARYAMVLNQMPRLFIETLAFGALFAGVWLVFRFGSEPTRVLPTLAVFAVAAIRLLPSVNRIAMSWTRMMFYYPAVEVVASARLQTEQMPPTVHCVDLPSDWTTLVLDHVSYRYPAAIRDALTDVSLEIRKGDRVAIVGESGSGKTTLVDVILGLLPPTEGSIRVCSQNKEVPLGTWRRVVGYVPQTVALIDDSIRRNVAFGVPDAVIDDRRVWEALTAAHLAEHVRKRADALDCVIGENGINFSGGQRQRIGIARAIYHGAEVLIMDEATSALDDATERAVGEAIDFLASSTTLVVIAHRAETIERCSRRIRLNHGKIVT